MIDAVHWKRLGLRVVEAGLGSLVVALSLGQSARVAAGTVAVAVVVAARNFFSEWRREIERPAKRGACD